MEAILATDISGGIAREGIIPWKSKKDMKFFLQKTQNNVVIMGKNTFLSLPEAHRPLKNRLNIVLTRDPYYYINNPEYMQHSNLIFTDDENIHNYIQQNRVKIYEIYAEIMPVLSSNFKIFFIGGKQIYEKYIPLCETVWHTTIKRDWSCDLFFNYDYQNLFKAKLPLVKAELVEEDDELKIVEWKKIF
jgi:dihydrofolate reductase